MCRVSLIVAPMYQYHVASCFYVEFLQWYEGMAAKYNTPASNKRQVSVLVVKKITFLTMFFACFPFLHMALDGMAGGGGVYVYVRGLPWLFYLDLSMNCVHVALKRPCETLQLFFTGYRAFFLVIHHPFCFFMNALPT